MKLIHDLFAIINIIGCLGGMGCMACYYRKVEFKRYERIWNAMGLACFAFCFLAMIREVYSLLLEHIAVWPFKFVTSGIYIITYIYYFLAVRYKKLDKQLNDKDDE